jgi:hypothetical protein
MSKLTTRKYAERREMTCGYAEGVDGINTAWPLSRTAPRATDTTAESALRSVTGQLKCAQCVLFEGNQLAQSNGPIRLRV